MNNLLYAVQKYDQFGRSLGMLYFKEQGDFNSYQRDPRYTYVAQGMVPVADMSIVSEVNQAGVSEMLMLVG